MSELKLRPLKNKSLSLRQKPSEDLSFKSNGEGSAENAAALDYMGCNTAQYI